MPLLAAPPGTTDFYSAAAQIIPVLVLVLVVEQRDEKRRLSPLANLIYVLATIGIAAVGETIALRDLYRGHAFLQDQYIVVAAMIGCGLALTVPIVTSSLREIETALLKGEGRRWTSAAAWTLAGVVTYIVVVFFIIAIKQH